MNYELIRERLYAMADDKYRVFVSSLIPNHGNLIGVRLPDIRKLASEIAKENPEEFLSLAKDDSFEEIMLQGFVISKIDDFEKVKKLCQNHIAKIYNWSLCDSFVTSLKIFNNHKPEVFEFIQSYLKSDQTYNLRFAVVVLLDYFVEEEYLSKLFKIFDSIKNDDYYVKMALAWAISVCFVKFPDDTMEYLKNCDLRDDVFNKALQKIRESNRVKAEIKAVIKNMKK